MKLTKKLLILTLMVSLLIPTAAVSSENPHSDVMLLSDGGSQTPGDYEDNELKAGYPNSVQPLKAV